jgi:dGTPase
VAAALHVNVDLVEALALVHDIGHPPFGHAGEKALDAAMRERGFSFDHNLHALRIVEDFEIRYAAFRGLNLTFEVREGIIKHSRDYDPNEFPELGEYALDQLPPLEAQLIDLADEIAYNTADLDDGFEAHLLSLEEIRSGVPVFERYFQEVEAIYPQAPDKLKFNETIKRMLDRMVGDLIRNTERRIQEGKIFTLGDLRRHPERLAALSAEVEEERRATKAFLYENLYFSPSLSDEKGDAEIVVASLFSYWMDRPSDLPHQYQEKAQQEPLPRIICDYIAGMTDHFIYEQYDRFCPART